MQLHSCEHRGTLRLLPFGGHKRQRVVVGDDTGRVLCFGIKKFETKMQFSTELEAGTAISDVCVTRGSGKAGDAGGRIFVSSGASVAGINKKGKVYFSFKSNMSESIENLHVENRKIWASGEYVFCSFDESGSELHYYMCPDKINAMLMLNNTLAGGGTTSSRRRQPASNALLGCQDSTLRVVSGDAVTFEAAVSGAVRSVAELRTMPTRAKTVAEEDPGPKRGGILGRFGRKGKKRDKEKGGGDGEEQVDEGSKGSEGAEPSEGKGGDAQNGAAIVDGGGGGGGGGKSAERAPSPDGTALKTAFVYGTTTGGLGSITVQDGAGRRAWFVQPPVVGEARYVHVFCICFFVFGILCIFMPWPEEQRNSSTTPYRTYYALGFTPCIHAVRLIAWLSTISPGTGSTILLSHVTTVRCRCGPWVAITGTRWTALGTVLALSATNRAG